MDKIKRRMISRILDRVRGELVPVMGEEKFIDLVDYACGDSGDNLADLFRKISGETMTGRIYPEQQTPVLQPHDDESRRMADVLSVVFTGGTGCRQ